jgi:hypothetical protein
MKKLILCTAIFATVLLSSCSRQETGKIIGIKIYDYSGDFDLLAAKWSDMGINTAFVSRQLAADTAFRMALKRRKIPVFVIFPVFQDPDLLDKDSTLYAITGKGLKAKDEWVEFVCPTRESVRKLKLAQLDTIIRDLKPDGISIDFIRQFVYWEKIYPGTNPKSIDRACYCDSCLARFAAENKITIPSYLRNSVEKAKWIDKNHAKSWSEFRCDQITEMAERLSDEARKLRPGIMISLHAVPWREQDFDNAGKRIAGQDLRKLSRLADFISPMCYSQMVMRDDKWIHSIVREMNGKAKGKVLPSIQVYPYYNNKAYSREDFMSCLNKALEYPSRGVVFFSWPLFVRDSSRMDSVRSVLGRIPPR